ncbi:MAG: mannose-1-phosphate guanylyltransferase/mannose-6-phosphate isomerase [Brachymonas sp.]|nr:mannose-1-phosphate guanylyltransferase/mannose-6-phosphate isomerase [Brachymonas sp.]
MNEPVKRIVAVILSGGAGTRLWPVSRSASPKQFQNFGAEHSLLSQTVRRADKLEAITEIVVVASAEHESLLQAHIKPHTNKPVTIIYEPIAKNTAAAIALAAQFIGQEDALMFVMPSDHHMEDDATYAAAAATAMEGAQQGYLVTFGITPARPDTGFGYIEIGEALHQQDSSLARVARFVEKPDSEKAKAMLATGQFVWNSGMFVMPVGLFLAELSRFERRICETVAESVRHGILKNSVFRPLATALQDCPSISVDYGVFERSSRVAVVRLNMLWNDLGSWSAIADLAQARGLEGNFVVNVNAQGNYAHSSKHVAFVGVDDLILVETPDALLITHRDASQSVKEAVTGMRELRPDIVMHHRKVQRPWGNYDSIDSGSAHQVKRILVEPGGRLSLQSHAQRAEHWVVIAGMATVTVDETVKNYSVGQHVFIPLGAKHRLENLTTSPVEIIEVQIGGYLGEDDIIRYDDAYGRA